MCDLSRTGTGTTAQAVLFWHPHSQTFAHLEPGKQQCLTASISVLWASEHSSGISLTSLVSSFCRSHHPATVWEYRTMSNCFTLLPSFHECQVSTGREEQPGHSTGRDTIENLRVSKGIILDWVQKHRHSWSEVIPAPTLG